MEKTNLKAWADLASPRRRSCGACPARDSICLTRSLVMPSSRPNCSRVCSLAPSPTEAADDGLALAFIQMPQHPLDRLLHSLNKGAS